MISGKRDPTSRAGLNLFARYFRGIEIDQHIDRMFAPMRKLKGAPIRSFFKTDALLSSTAPASIWPTSMSWPRPAQRGRHRISEAAMVLDTVRRFSTPFPGAEPLAAQACSCASFSGDCAFAIPTSSSSVWTPWLWTTTTPLNARGSSPPTRR